MNKKDAKNLLPLYLEGELDEKESAALQECLAQNPDLQKHAHQLQKAWNLLGEVDEIEPSPTYISQFWTELSLRESWKHRVWIPFRNSFWGKRLVPVLASVSLIILVGMMSFKNYGLVSQVDQQIASLPDHEYEMVENIELVENLDIIEDLEFFENYDVIEELEV